MFFLNLDIVEDEGKVLLLEKFYRENIDFLLNFSNKYFSDKTKAEEAIHEAFVIMIKNEEKYIKEDMDEMKKIAISIIKSKSIDILRKDKRYVGVPIEDLQIYIDIDKKVEDKIIKDEEISYLKNLLKSLDEISKEIIIMKYFKEMSAIEYISANQINRTSMNY